MGQRITRKDVESKFLLWVDAGKSVGALTDSKTYTLEHGNKTQGNQYAVAVEETYTTPDGESKRRRVTSSVFPFLGFTPATAYAVLSNMTEAWRLVQYPA